MDESQGINAELVVQVGALIGALAGAVVWLTRALVGSKNHEIDQLNKATEALVAAKNEEIMHQQEEINRLINERNIFRDQLMGRLDRNERSGYRERERDYESRERDRDRE